MRPILFVTAGLLAALAACTWVKPTEAGAGVVVAQAFSVTGCKHLGKTTTSVKHKIADIDRKAAKVKQELTVLAQDGAAAMNGDTIVAQGPPRDGSMTFDIYRCQD